MVPLDHGRGCYFQLGFFPEQNEYRSEISLWVAQKQVLLLLLLLLPLISCSVGQASDLTKSQCSLEQYVSYRTASGSQRLNFIKQYYQILDTLREKIAWKLLKLSVVKMP